VASAISALAWNQEQQQQPWPRNVKGGGEREGDLVGFRTQVSVQ